MAVYVRDHSVTGAAQELHLMMTLRGQKEGWPSPTPHAEKLLSGGLVTSPRMAEQPRCIGVSPQEMRRGCFVLESRDQRILEKILLYQPGSTNTDLSDLEFSVLA